MSTDRADERAVDLWWIDLAANPESVSELALVLDGRERERADQFRFSRDRARFIVARSALRYILARYEGRCPADLEFITGARGKPFLKHSTELRFNLSHSDDLALLGIVQGQEIGVDVEKIRSLPDLPAMADRAFYRDELDQLRRLSKLEYERAFYRIWTRGEAFLKWQGCGLIEPDIRRTMLNDFSGLLVEIDAPESYASAIALSRHDAHIKQQNWVYPTTRSFSPGFPSLS
jgi:4'-phosphopantetheinyl transferase